ncbi:unnamed protein product [marine sediment metagenome]|uniref:Uncharacterized protein n=1 Tax=marine sediment metagenome TaxID=412755 RepID=X1AW41_9ZZZZ
MISDILCMLRIHGRFNCDIVYDVDKKTVRLSCPRCKYTKIYPSSYFSNQNEKQSKKCGSD